ncbi:MAG TPA: hypothetical protein VI078_14745 [bacterium]
MSNEPVERKHDHVIHYKVNDEPQETTQRTLTPHQIMTLAGIKPGDYYLVEIKGRNRDSFQNREDVAISMHENQKFVTVFTGPVPVS